MCVALPARFSRARGLSHSSSSLLTPNEAFVRYLEKFSPLNLNIEGRMVIAKETKQEREWGLVEERDEGAEAGRVWVWEV